MCPAKIIEVMHPLEVIENVEAFEFKVFPHFLTMGMEIILSTAVSSVHISACMNT